MHSIFPSNIIRKGQKSMKHILLFLVFSLSRPIVFAGGNGVGNGGGFALCEDQQFYAYDYLLTLDQQTLGRDVPVDDVQTSLLQIVSQLKRLEDSLAQQLEFYISLMFKQTPGAPYQWFERQNLQLMWEPDLALALPKSCPLRKQAVYFYASFAGLPYSSYTYDPALIQNILGQKNGALQISYLWVHEWLWNYFDRVDFKKIALLNRLLHSEKLLSMSKEEFEKWLSIYVPRL